MDAAIGDFLTQAAEMGALQDTLVLFWSDHGEQFFEDDLFGHGRDLHDEEVDAVGFFWRAVGGLEPVVWEGPTATWDLAPTVLEAFGLPQSEDFTGWAAGTASVDRRRVGVDWNYSDSSMTMEKEGWKLLYLWNGTLALYDRNTDRGEEQDLVGSEDTRVLELWGLLRPRVRDLVLLRPESMPPVEPTLP
jgi:arylsulfatase A-like enzyme